MLYEMIEIILISILHHFNLLGLWVTISAYLAKGYQKSAQFPVQC